MNRSKGLVIALGVLVVLGGLLALVGSMGSLSFVSETPDCVFALAGSQKGGVSNCTVFVDVPQDRSLISLKVSTRFSSIPGSAFGGRTLVSPTATVEGTSETSSSNSKHSISLYETPSSWTNVEEVFVETGVRGEGTCGNRETAYSSGTIYAMPYQYAQSTMTVCTKSDNDNCALPYTVYDYGKDFDANGETVGEIPQVGRCSTSLTKSDQTLSYTGTLPRNTIFSDKAKFMVDTRSRTQGGTAKATPQPVFVSYRRAEYPTNVAYSVGTRYVASLSGEQKGDVILLDLSELANTYCGRPTTGKACRVPIVFTSTSGGKMWVDVEKFEKLNPSTAPVAPPVVAPPVYTNPTPNPTQPPVVTPTPTPTPTPADPVLTNPVAPEPVAENRVSWWTSLKEWFRSLFSA
jgi:hypothetical protein